MNICPNKNSRNWKLAVDAIGEFHTMTYWMTTQGELDTPDNMLDTLIEIYPERKDEYEALLTQYYNRKSSQDSVNYMLKATSILLTNKAADAFRKGEKNNWPLEKILSELQIPKEQKNIILNSGLKKLSDITSFLAKEFSFPIQIADAYTDIDPIGIFSDDPSDAQLPKPVLTGDYYYLTVPGGNNYREVRVITPSIIPAIKGHAKFAKNTDIGWLRVDDEIGRLQDGLLEEDVIINSYGDHIKKGTSAKDFIAIYNKNDNIDYQIDLFSESPEDYGGVEDFITTYGNDAYDKVIAAFTKKSEGDLNKTLRVLELQSDLFQRGRDKEVLTSAVDPSMAETFIFNGNIYRAEGYIDYAGDQDYKFYKQKVGDNFERKITEDEFNKIWNQWNKSLEDIPTNLKKDFDNKFLQLLNKDGNWTTVFVKSIIQDAAKRGYEKVLFPLGDTAAKVEGHDTLENFRTTKLSQIFKINQEIENYKAHPAQAVIEWNVNQGIYDNQVLYYADGRYLRSKINGVDEIEEIFDDPRYAEDAAIIKNEQWQKEKEKGDKVPEEVKVREVIESLENEKAQYEQELARVEGPEGFGALRPVYNFYQNTIANILKKQGYEPSLYTDANGNSWNEIEIHKQRDTSAIQFNSRMTPKQFKKFLNEKYGRKVQKMYFIDGTSSNYVLVRNAIAMYNNERGGFFVELVPTKTDTRYYSQSYYIKSYENGKGMGNLAAKFTDIDYLTESYKIEVDEDKLRPDRLKAVTQLQFAEMNAEELDRAQAGQLVAKIAKSLGLTNEDGTAAFNVVTPEQASLITANSINKLDDAPAFFYNGQVYIVQGNLNSENIFHEFAHPFVKALLAYNPSLFDNLYSKAWREFENAGYDQVFYAEYPDLIKGTDSFKEEVIVKALTRYAQMKIAGNPVSKTFADIINNIMYGIKKMIKALIGKNVNVSELSPNTSLADLANKMLTTEFAIDSNIVTKKDFINANRRIKVEMDDYIKELETKLQDPLKSKDNEFLLQRNIDRFYNLVNVQIQKLLSEKKYADLAGLLVDEFDSKDLQNIRANIGKYTDVIITKAKEVMDENVQNKRKSIAFVNGLRRLEYITNKLRAAIETNIEDLTSIDNLYRVKYYNDFIKSYDNFMVVLKKDLNQMRIPTSSPIYNLVNTIANNIEAAKQSSHEVYGEGLLDTLWDVLKPTADKIDARHKERMEYLERRGAPEKLKRVEQASYDAIKLSKEGFKKILDGEMDDAGMLNTLLEGYLYNQDPLVGSFALYVKKNFVEVQSNIQNNKTRFMAEVIPALQKAGFNAYNLTTKIDKLLHLDSKAIKSGPDLVKTPVWELLSQFKDYKWWMAEQRFKIAKANDDYLNDKTDEKRDALNKLKADFSKDLKLYFHQPFSPEYYEREELFERDDVGREAKRLRDEIYTELGQIDESVRNGFEVKDETKRRENALRKLRELSSITDRFGKLKPAFERAIAERLKEYRELSQDMFTYRERSGVFINDLIDYEDQLVQEGLERTDEEFIDKREKFILANTRIVIKPEFNIFIGQLYERLKELEEKKNTKNQERIKNALQTKLSKRGVSQNIIDSVTTVSDLYTIISDLSSIYKDEDRQTMAMDMDPSAISSIKALEEIMEEVRLESSLFKNLTEEESEYISDYFIRLKEFDLGIIDTEAEKGTPEYDAEMDAISDELTEQYDYVQELIQKQKDNGLTKKENEEYNKILSDLKDLRTKHPTQYYLDIYNNYLTTIDTDFIHDEINQRIIDSDESDFFLRPDIVDEIKSQNSEFEVWFDKNHILTQRYSKEEGDYIDVYKRLSIWEYSLPNDPEYYETMEVPSADGEEIVTIIGQPAFKYFMREVKPEFQTKKIFPGAVDENGKRLTPNVDNTGSWLPKTVAQGAPSNSPFINPNYERLRNDDPLAFEALNKLTEYYLSIQEDVEDNVKLFMEIPRMMPDSKETTTQLVTQPGEVVTPFKRWWYNTKAFFKRSPDAAQEGELNWQDNEAVPDELEFFIDKSKSIPIEGKSMLKYDIVSKDIPRSILRYMASLEKHKKLVEISPVATALQEYLKDPITGKNKSLKQLVKERITSKPGSIILDGADDKDKDKKRRNAARGIREEAIDALIDREFYGQIHNNKWGGDSAFLNNFTSFLTKAASFSFFALDIPSALVNYFDAKVQNKIEAYGGRYMNPITYNMGNIWATKAMTMISAEVYSTGPKSETVQLVELFDPGQDFLKKSTDDPLSRHILGDLVKLNFLMSPRKWLEFQASLAIMGGMMHHQNVEQVVDGESRLIRYIDAWEKDASGNLRLKDGVDKKWDRDGEAFKDYRIKIQQVVSNVNGAFGEFDQPLASKYLIYRMIAFLQKHFTSMFMNHFAFKGGLKAMFGKTGGLQRYDWGLQDVSSGYFIQTLNYLINGFRTAGAGLIYMSKEEAYAIFKTLRWMASLYIMSLLKSLFFGYDDEDKDRFKKMYARSGPLPLFGAEYDKGYKARAQFNTTGWMLNNLLYVTIRTNDDTEEWLPLPYFGLSNYSSMASIKAGAMTQPTIENYTQILTGLVGYIGDGLDGERDLTNKDLYYQQEAGAYPWLKEGSPKFLKPLVSIFGITGGSTDPGKKVETFEGYDK